MSVSARFTTFLKNISLTDEQLTKGRERIESVVEVLNSKYYSSSSKTLNSTFVGSWGKATRVRPPRDVDVLFKLPNSVYDRYEQRTGNKQSQLLQEVKTTLKATFSNTDIHGDGPVVVVPFVSYNVELIPAFELTNGKFWIPMTDKGGRYKTADYEAEKVHISNSNDGSNGNTRDLIRMMKRWQAYCSVPLKSFWIELLAVEFISGWKHKGQTKTYYDFMVRDFLEFLIKKSKSWVFAPGTLEMMNLGDSWKSRAETAYARAVKACKFELDSNFDSAGEEWQKIFGTDIPRNP